MKPIKVANALACEYIAPGSRGKHTLINVYTGDILVGELPATIPMAFYFEVLPENAPERVEMKFQVMVDDDMRAELGVEFPANRSEMGLVVLPQLPIQFQKAATVKVIGSGPNYRKTVLIQKSVSVGPIPA